MTNQTPATEAGRQFAERLSMVKGTAWPQDVAAIIAIEAEARASRDMDTAYEAGREDGRADALREAADAVRALHGKSADHGLYAGDALLGWTMALRAAGDAILDPETKP